MELTYVEFLNSFVAAALAPAAKVESNGQVATTEGQNVGTAILIMSEADIAIALYDSLGLSSYSAAIRMLRTPGTYKLRISDSGELICIRI